MAKKTTIHPPIKMRHMEFRPTVVDPPRIPDTQPQRSSSEMRITTPTILALHVGNIHLHEAIMRVFNTYGDGPFNLEALIHLAMHDLDVNPTNYPRIYDRVKNYIINHFEVVQGSLIPQGQVTLRNVLISFKTKE